MLLFPKSRPEGHESPKPGFGDRDLRAELSGPASSGNRSQSTAYSPIWSPSLAKDTVMQDNSRNGSTADNCRASKEGVLAAAQRLLHATGHQALRAIVCEMEGDTLIMIGTVQTFYQKQLAQVALLNRPEIPKISNRIHVEIRLGNPHRTDEISGGIG